QPGAGNLISGNNSGIFVNGAGNVVQGNLIGTDVTGTRSLANHRGSLNLGVSVDGPNNRIGGTDPGAGNVISGMPAGYNQEFGSGVVISQPESTGNMVQGNFIGTDRSGTAAVGNGMHGVLLEKSASNNLIGGTTAAARNVIAGNGGSGVYFFPSPDADFHQ